MRKALGKIIYGILIGIFSVLLFGNVWLLSSRYVFHQNPPSICGFSPVAVLSGSMEPAFYSGDLLIIQKQENYRKNEIVTFEDGGVLTTHRIVDRTPKGFLTKGDSNNISDRELVSEEQIKGRLALRIPKAGKFFLFLRSPLGLLLFLISGWAVLFLPPRIRNWITHRKERAD